jgi:RNA polymerase sigma factor for flagellar operon FliA
MDELREYDPVPRLVRSRQATLDRFESAFVGAHGRAPEPAEIAGELGLADGEVGKLIRDGRAGRYLSMNEPGMFDDSGRPVEHGDLLPDTRLEEPGEAADREAWWARMCEGLDRADRLIVVLYYREGLNMREIGRTLGFCESRVSQRLKAILARLKARLTGEPERFPRAVA